MFSILLTPLLMLLSVFGLYSHPTQHSSPFPSATVRPRTTADNTTSTTTPAQKPAAVATTAVTKKEVAVAQTETSKPAKTPEVQAEPAAEQQPPAVPQSDFVSRAETRILVLMNSERANEGLPALALDAQLSKLARAHSADMIARDFFDHKNPDGCSSSCRANNADYSWSAIGENIYMTEGYDLSAEAEAAMVVDGWMHSDGHRANILGSKYTNTGVGVVVQGEKVYVTAMYSKPR